LDFQLIFLLICRNVTSLLLLVTSLALPGIENGSYYVCQFGGHCGQNMPAIGVLASRAHSLSYLAC